MAAPCDAELRLECARLAAVFSGAGDLRENAERLYAFLKDQQPDAASHSFCPHCGYDMRREEIVELGCARFEARGQFTYDGRAVHLSPNERITVETLLRARGSYVASQILVDRIDISGDDPLSHVRVYMRRVRDKLEAVGAPRGIIESGYSLGYRWAVDREQQSEAA